MLFGIFGRKKEKRDNAPLFDGALIGKFARDHKELAGHIEKVYRHFERGEEAKVVKTLKRMQKKALNHFMEEDLKLYWYLRKHYSEDPSALMTIRNFEEEIKPIQKEVILFFDRYTEQGAKLDGRFKQGFDEIVKRLVKRIEAEEAQLYPLYKEE